MLHHDPGLVNHNQSRLKLRADLVPQELQDDIHGDRPEFLFKVADIEDDKLAISRDVRLMVEES